MTQAIVGAIEPELGNAERERARRKPPDNLDAWSCYQRGLWHLFRFTKADNEAAEQLFQRSAVLDPGFSGAFMGLAIAGYWNVLFGHVDSANEVLASAFTAVRMAVSLDDKDAMAHWALGRVYTQMGDPRPQSPNLRPQSPSIQALPMVTSALVEHSSWPGAWSRRYPILIWHFG
jgi:hypothetical protein